MKTEHLQQCADAGYEECCEFMEPNNRLAFAKATISTYLKLNPVWVKASERMPTREDADEMEYVAVFDYESGFDLIKFNFKNPELFWTSIKHLPPPPFEDWLAKQPDDVRAVDKELVRKIYNSIKL